MPCHVTPHAEPGGWLWLLIGRRMRHTAITARPAPHDARGSIRARNSIVPCPGPRMSEMWPRPSAGLLCRPPQSANGPRGAAHSKMKSNSITQLSTPVHPSKQQNRASASGGRNGAFSGAAQPSGSSSVPRDTDIKMDCSVRFTTVSATPADTGGVR